MRQDNLEACTTTAKGAPSSNGCVENWKVDLKKTSNAVAIAEVVTDQAQKAYGNASAWEAQLKAYLDKLTATAKIGQTVDSILQLLENQTESVGKNATRIEDSLLIIYKMITGFFYDMDVLLEEVNALLNDIKNIGDSSINAETSKVVKCLEDFKAALQTAIDMEKATIENVVQVLVSIYVLTETNNHSMAYCGHNDNRPTPCGFTDTLTKLIHLFNPGAEEGHNEEYEEAVVLEENDSNEGSKRVFVPRPCRLPGFRMPVAENPYPRRIQALYDQAQENTLDAKNAYEDSRKKLSELTACKTSLTNAIDAATEAKGC